MEEVEQILTNLQLFQTQVSLERNQKKNSFLFEFNDIIVYRHEKIILYKYNLLGWLYDVNTKRIKKSAMHYR